MFSFTVNKVFLFIFFSFCSYNLFFYINPTPKIKSDLHIFSLKINHLSNPFGIDIHNNSFSFLTDMEGPFRAFLISLDNNNKTTHSKKLFLKNCHSFYFDKPLEYQTSYIFRVETNNYYNEIKFETAAKLNAPFIKPKNDKIESPIFFKEFEVNKKYNINKARLYITGLGLYQAYINNQKVGKGYLTPGFNDYDFYLRYQTYDIYDLIQEKNVIEVQTPEYGFFGAIRAGTKEAFNAVSLTLKSLTVLFKGVEVKNAVSGPARVTDMLGSTIKEGFSEGAKIGIISTLSLLAIISVSLFIMNLLPIPVLDGGLILIALIELIAGKKIKPKIQYYIQMVGIAFIILIFLVGLTGDITYFTAKK